MSTAKKIKPSFTFDEYHLEVEIIAIQVTFNLVGIVQKEIPAFPYVRCKILLNVH